MSAVLGFAVMLLAPLVLGLVFAFVQSAIYGALIRAGKMKPEDVPFFGILLLRGLVLAIALAGVLALALHLLPQR